MKISFVVPGRPKGKERPRFNTKTGRVYTPQKTKALERGIAKLGRAAMGARQPWTGPVKLTLVAVFAIPKSWPAHLRQPALDGRVWHVAKGQLDLDNAIKLVSDALNGIVFVDDAQVAVVTCGKRFGHPERTEVRIEALEQREDAVTPGQRRKEAPPGH